MNFCSGPGCRKIIRTQHPLNLCPECDLKDARQAALDYAPESELTQRRWWGRLRALCGFVLALFAYKFVESGLRGLSSVVGKHPILIVVFGLAWWAWYYSHTAVKGLEKRALARATPWYEN